MVELTEEPQGPLQVLRGIVAILRCQTPMVVCIEQLKSVLNDPEGPRQLSIQLMELKAAVPSHLVILNCLEAEWHVMQKSLAFDSLSVHLQPLRLDSPTDDQKLALASCRLRSLTHRPADSGHLWPFDADSLAKDLKRQAPPRVVIQHCAAAFERWREGTTTPPEGID